MSGKHVSHERGSALAWAMAVVAVVALAAAAVGTTAAALHARGAAQSAADLGALAAAHVARDMRAIGADLPSSQSRVCERAGSVVRVNNAQLHRCTMHVDGSVTVESAVPWGPGEVRRAARAGHGQ